MQRTQQLLACFLVWRVPSIYEQYAPGKLIWSQTMNLLRNHNAAQNTSNFSFLLWTALWVPNKFIFWVEMSFRVQCNLTLPRALKPNLDMFITRSSGAYYLLFLNSLWTASTTENVQDTSSATHLRFADTAEICLHVFFNYYYYFRIMPETATKY